MRTWQKILGAGGLAIGMVVTTVPPASASHLWPVVGQGNSGRDVFSLQHILRARGYSLTADGIFGSTTRSRTISYQQAAGISPADGIWGDVTWPNATPSTLASGGSTGEYVRACEAQLGVARDGSWGSSDASAWQALERSLGVTSDGVCSEDDFRRAVYRNGAN